MGQSDLLPQALLKSKCFAQTGSEAAAYQLRICMAFKTMIKFLSISHPLSCGFFLRLGLVIIVGKCQQYAKDFLRDGCCSRHGLTQSKVGNFPNRCIK